MDRIICILALLSLTASARANTVAYAIVVGNNAPPSPELPRLHYADDDAIRYFRLFRQLGEAHLLTVLDRETQRRHRELAPQSERPTLANLLAVVDALAPKMRADRARGDRPVLYFAYSGHGAESDGGGAFLALEDQPLTRQVLYDGILARLPAVNVHLIIDACRAAAVVGVRGGMFEREREAQKVAVSPEEILPRLDTLIERFPHVGVVLAASADEETHEWSLTQSGLFTHEVLSGLVGPADVNGDRRVEYSEIQAFVAAANRTLADPRALLHMVVRPPRNDQGIALLSLAALRDFRLVTGKAGMLGHFHVELGNGERYLDAHLTDETPTTFAIPRDSVAFVESGDREGVITEGRHDVALARVPFGDRRLAERGSIDHSYRAALFASPFGPTYYRGFVDSVGAISVEFARSPEPARRLPWPPRRRAAVALFVAAAALAAVTVGTSVVAVRAKHDFDSTNLQMAAYAASQRYQWSSTLAITAGALVLVGTGAGAALWLRPVPHFAIAPSAHGVQAEAGVELKF